MMPVEGDSLLGGTIEGGGNEERTESEREAMRGIISLKCGTGVDLCE